MAHGIGATSGAILPSPAALCVFPRRCAIKINRATLRDRARNAAAGVTKDLAGVTTITLNGVDYTLATLTALLQSFVTLADAAVTARGAWLVAVQKEQAARAGIVAVLAALRSYVILKFGEAAVDTLADFGFSPRKKVVKTAETKAQAAKQATATKAARKPTSATKSTATSGASSTAPVSPATTTTQPEPAATPPQAPVAAKS